MRFEVEHILYIFKCCRNAKSYQTHNYKSQGVVRALQYQNYNILIEQYIYIYIQDLLI